MNGGQFRAEQGGKTGFHCFEMSLDDVILISRCPPRPPPYLCKAGHKHARETLTRMTTALPVGPQSSQKCPWYFLRRSSGHEDATADNRTVEEEERHVNGGPEATFNPAKMSLWFFHNDRGGGSDMNH